MNYVEKGIEINENRMNQEINLIKTFLKRIFKI